VNDSISRRSFIGGVVASSVGAAAAKTGSLPTRVLGRTGATPSVMALGCGSRLLSYKDQDKAVETLNMALDSGVTYLDTSQNYGNGRSETWVGEVMQTRRKEVWLATKTGARYVRRRACADRREPKAAPNRPSGPAARSQPGQRG